MSYEPFFWTAARLVSWEVTTIITHQLVVVIRYINVRSFKVTISESGDDCTRLVIRHGLGVRHVQSLYTDKLVVTICLYPLNVSIKKNTVFKIINFDTRRHKIRPQKLKLNIHPPHND